MIATKFDKIIEIFLRIRSKSKISKIYYFLKIKNFFFALMLAYMYNTLLVYNLIIDK